MCLAVPAKVIEIAQSGEAPLSKLAQVDLQGNRLEVGIDMTPEVQVGQWVLVHAGYALEVLDETEARETWQYLADADLAEMPDELRAGEDSAS